MLAGKSQMFNVLGGCASIKIEIFPYPLLSKNLVKNHGELSISEVESITKANRNTLKKKLAELVKDKYLLTQGQGKGTRYIIGSK